MKNKSAQLESAVILFAGDSGDGMQLTGTQFSDTSAFMGNDISTFPDYPAEIRAPQGTIAGVSGFQVHIGSSAVLTPGDEADMLVAMNPAALKAKLPFVKVGGVILVNTDSFTEKNLEKAKFLSNPLDDDSLKEYQLIKAPISTQTLEALKDFDLDRRSKERCKNFYALGMTYYLYGRSAEQTLTWIENKFAKRPDLVKANSHVLKTGIHFAETIEAVVSTYQIPAAKIQSGHYRQINGNTATAWGFMRASEVAGTPLFFGSYPITPASDILHELSKYQNVKSFQAEDEIAAVCAAIGASWCGHLALTSSSGPGITLKAEAIGLAISYELPLVVINVQRGGPSTGLPTKTEQSDLLQAMFGRNGESPVIIVAPSRPSDCFEMAYEAARLALKYMCPVMFLSDGHIANGSEPWKIPDLSQLKECVTYKVDAASEGLEHFKRDPKTMARPWPLPGQPGLEYRIGGLEKDFQTGGVSSDPDNHEKMVYMRASKITKASSDIPEQDILGEKEGDLLVVSWGGTYGSNYTAVERLQQQGHRISHMHLRYINPMPQNVESLLKSFKKVVVSELNTGQMKFLLNSKFSIDALGYNQVQGLPFKSAQLERAYLNILEGMNNE